eukprot:10162-Heterococcus_DN1.PRE.3
MLACYQAADLAVATIAPGVTNAKVTEVINKVAKSYNVKFIAGAKMHQLKHYIINGNKTVVTRETSQQHQCPRGHCVSLWNGASVMLQRSARGALLRNH